MKKAISLLLVLVIALSCTGLAACFGTVEPPADNGTPPPDNGTPPADDGAPPPDDGTPPPTGGGFTWNDIPIPSGANQIQELSWAMPPADEDEYSQVEWRYYETGDSVSSVTSFYKSQMPAYGWEQMGWMESQEVSWGWYTKNQEQDAAMVWIGDDDGTAGIALMRASE